MQTYGISEKKAIITINDTFREREEEVGDVNTLQKNIIILGNQMKTNR